MVGALLATKPKQLSHQKYWDREAFSESLVNFSGIHTIFDSTFRSPTYNRLATRQSRRPAIAIKLPPSAEEQPVVGESRGKIRHRKDDDEELEDIPPDGGKATSDTAQTPTSREQVTH